MEKDYNRIVLIGNGFDLAAGLKTSYKNFIDNYFKNAIIKLFEKRSFESDILTFKMNENVRLSKSKDLYIEEIIENIKTVEDALEYVKNYSKPEYKFDFFKEIVQELQNERWVDIEQSYYNRLKNIYNNIHNQDLKELALKNIQKLNNCMDAISAELHQYVFDEQKSNKISSTDSPLISVLEKCQKPLRPEISKLVPKHNRTQEPTNVVFLNFNYTNTIKTLANNHFLKPDNQIINIHGSVDSSNPIIFGYGDDTGEDYKELESVGENDLLLNLKSAEMLSTKVAKVLCISIIHNT